MRKMNNSFAPVVTDIEEAIGNTIVEQIRCRKMLEDVTHSDSSETTVSNIYAVIDMLTHIQSNCDDIIYMLLSFADDVTFDNSSEKVNSSANSHSKISYHFEEYYEVARKERDLKKVLKNLQRQKKKFHNSGDSTQRKLRGIAYKRAAAQ